MPSRSFLPLAVTPVIGGELKLKSVVMPHATSTASGDDDDGGIASMKEAMAPDEVGSICDTSPLSTDFTRVEIDDMEKLIVSLSRESDDNMRRQTLAEILDKELVGSLNAESDSQGGAATSDIPRFARLFQISLDSVGESVQAAARVVALEKQMQQEKKMADDYDATDAENPLVRPEKSQEELQLWALIDMMVQSKTRVKLHMGSMGSKGKFR